MAYTTLYCTLLDYTLLFYTMLYYAVLYYLYYTILYYAIYYILILDTIHHTLYTTYNILYTRNYTSQALSIFTDACLACVQRILDLTSQAPAFLIRSIKVLCSIHVGFGFLLFFDFDICGLWV